MAKAKSPPKKKAAVKKMPKKEMILEHRKAVDFRTYTSSGAVATNLNSAVSVLFFHDVAGVVQEHYRLKETAGDSATYERLEDEMGIETETYREDQFRLLLTPNGANELIGIIRGRLQQMKDNGQYDGDIQ